MVSDEEILSTFDEIRGPYVTSSELEGELPIDRHAINKRLKQLHDEGRVNRKQPVPQMVGWWLPGSNEDQASD